VDGSQGQRRQAERQAECEHASLCTLDSIIGESVSLMDLSYGMVRWMQIQRTLDIKKQGGFEGLIYGTRCGSIKRDDSRRMRRRHIRVSLAPQTIIMKIAKADVQLLPRLAALNSSFFSPVYGHGTGVSNSVPLVRTSYPTPSTTDLAAQAMDSKKLDSELSQLR
jgi:hypothetical protein